MDDRAVLLEEMLRIADHAVIEARPYRQQHVAMLHGHVRFIRAVHAKHAQKLTVGCWITAKPHQRIRARKTEQAHKLRELPRGGAKDDPTSAVAQRAMAARR